jgi:hypothetical protein
MEPTTPTDGPFKPPDLSPSKPVAKEIKPASEETVAAVDSIIGSIASKGSLSNDGQYWTNDINKLEIQDYPDCSDCMVKRPTLPTQHKLKPGDVFATVDLNKKIDGQTFFVSHKLYSKYSAENERWTPVIERFVANIKREPSAQEISSPEEISLSSGILGETEAQELLALLRSIDKTISVSKVSGRAKSFGDSIDQRLARSMEETRMQQFINFIKLADGKRYMLSKEISGVDSFISAEKFQREDGTTSLVVNIFLEPNSGELSPEAIAHMDWNIIGKHAYGNRNQHEELKAELGTDQDVAKRKWAGTKGAYRVVNILLFNENLAPFMLGVSAFVLESMGVESLSTVGVNDSKVDKDIVFERKVYPIGDNVVHVAPRETISVQAVIQNTETLASIKERI